MSLTKQSVIPPGRLRELRIGTGKTIEEFAEAADVGAFHYGQIERGKVIPRLGTLARIADALGVTLAEIFSGDDDFLDERSKRLAAEIAALSPQAQNALRSLVALLSRQGESYDQDG